MRRASTRCRRRRASSPGRPRSGPAAPIVGVSEIEFLGHPDGRVVEDAQACDATSPRRSAATAPTSSSPALRRAVGSRCRAVRGTAPTTVPSGGRRWTPSPTPPTAGSSPTSPRSRGPACSGSPSPTTRPGPPTPSTSSGIGDAGVRSLVAHEQYLRALGVDRPGGLCHRDARCPGRGHRPPVRRPPCRRLRAPPRPGGAGGLGRIRQLFAQTTTGVVICANSWRKRSLHRLGEVVDDLGGGERQEHRRGADDLGRAAAAADHDPLPLHHPAVDPQRQALPAGRTG